MPEVRLIDANALIQAHCGACANKKICAEEACPHYEIRRRIEAAPTIEPKRGELVIPKEVNASDIDKLTEMIKNSLLQAYPNDVMFTAVRRGEWNDKGHCSCCGYDLGSRVDKWTNVFNFAFCPNCGARMDGGADNNG